MYPSPFLEILDLNDTSNIEIEDEDIIYPMNIGLRRITNKNYCRMCKHIFYYDYPNGKLIKPFILNTMVNNTIINIEIVSFLYNNNNIAILDIKLVNVKVKPQYKFKSKNKEILNEDIFIKPTITYDAKDKNDTDASLIPSVIEFSNDYETDSAS